MKHIMFRTKVTTDEVLVDLFDRKDEKASPYIVTWKFMKSFGKKMFNVCVFDSIGEGMMTGTSIEPDEIGYYNNEFEIICDDVRYTLVVSYHEKTGYVDIDVSAEG